VIWLRDYWKDVVWVFLPIYLLGVFFAVLHGNIVIHDAAEASMPQYISLGCARRAKELRARTNIDSSGALLWRSYPVMTVTTAIVGMPECFNALMEGVRTYEGRFEIEVYDQGTHELVIHIVKY
jgi:hypothetical protein